MEAVLGKIWEAAQSVCVRRDQKFLLYRNLRSSRNRKKYRASSVRCDKLGGRLWRCHCLFLVGSTRNFLSEKNLRWAIDNNDVKPDGKTQKQFQGIIGDSTACV